MEEFQFGGAHTESKLTVLQNYLSAYQRVLKKTGLTTIYFDAFAGSGQIPIEEAGPLLAGVEDAVPFIEGSVQRALTVVPPFGRYLFVEKNRRRADALGSIRRQYPLLSERIEVRCSDANKEIAEFCKGTDWKRSRAVMFLDPFGNQVAWRSLEEIAKPMQSISGTYSRLTWA